MIIVVAGGGTRCRWQYAARRTITIDIGDSCLQAADDRLVTALGIWELIVVDAADGVVVMHRDRVQDVKLLVDRLKVESRSEHLHHYKVYRPCGSYDSLAVGTGFQVKRIHV